MKYDTQDNMSRKVMELNDFITLKLIDNKTVIFVNNEEFIRMMEAELWDYNEHFNSTDAQQVGKELCFMCGHNMVYAGFKKYKDYRAFGVCEFCDHYYEI